MPKSAIAVNNIHYDYGAVEAVKGISFDVTEGEIFGFLGPNGAGKSTTIKMLTGQIHPKKGEIVLLGQNTTHAIGKMNQFFGISFERTNLYEQMSAIENLKLFADLYDVQNFNPSELLSRVGLKNRGKDKVSTFSKGMKQRLMVARALVNTPKILFLDEPTEGLDPTSAKNIREIILQERERGATVFLTTHDMHEADKLSDRVAFINAGEIVALDTPYNLKQVYGKRALKAKIRLENGDLQEKEIMMDQEKTAAEMQSLFQNDKVITLHSEEATLEDIFVQMTGRGLTG